MPRILFIEHDGREHAVDARVGHSVMRAAVDHEVPGIVAECGGSMACGTCQGYIDAPWFERLPPRSAEETSMLEASGHMRANSRLTCQLTVQADMDGLIVRLPESQY
jgi:2Fe-2S ferredoxin